MESNLERPATPVMTHAQAMKHVDRLIESLSTGADQTSKRYFSGQRLRYIETLCHLPRGSAQLKCLEVGRSEVMFSLLKDPLGYGKVDCTIWNENTPYGRQVVGDSLYLNNDLERQQIDQDDDAYDLTLCCEVIEHMARDPMFMLSELNRVTKPGGTIFLSTPNIASARSLLKMMSGDMPYLYYHYLYPLSSGRHNLEYSPQLIFDLMQCAGFAVVAFWTSDTFGPAVPSVMELLKSNGYPTTLRGDNIFYIGTKQDRVKERYPEFLYHKWL